MPDLSSNLSTIRNRGHRLYAWLAVFGTDVVAEASITSITGDPVTSLGVTFTTGAYTDVYRNSEVEVFTSGGVSKGRLRVRSAGTLNSTTVPVAEVSDATVTITTGDTLKFYNDFRLRPKLPAADATFAPDQTTYSNQNTVMKPVVVSGGPIPAWVDDGVSYATISYDFSRSFTTDPDSGGSKSYFIAFPSGSTPGSSTSASGTVQIPVGDHTIQAVVTDTANSASQTHYTPARVFNDANPPIKIIINSLEGDDQMGWSCSFTPLDAMSLSDVPDGARIAIWVDEYYGSTNASYGNTDTNRSQVKFSGWLRSDTSTTTGKEQTQEFRCISNLERLGEINGFSQVFIDDPNANEWSEIDELSINLAMYQILRWYTTALDILDVVADNTDVDYPRFYLQANTPLLQLRELADGIDCRITCTRTGEIGIQKRQELTTLANRSSLTTTLTLTGQDILELQVDREHYRPVGLLEVQGITETGAAYFSRYPGNAFGDGSQNAVQDRIITTSQDDLNTRAGLRGAALDGVYMNGSGELRHAPYIRLVQRGAYDVFDFYPEWVALNINGTYNRRGVDLTKFRYILKRTSITYEKGTATTRIELQAETAANAGNTYIPPTPDDTQSLPDYDYTIPPLPPIDIPELEIELYPEPTGGISAAAIMSNGHIFTTTNFENASPTWTDNNHSASISGTVLQWTLDASSAYYTSGSGAVGGWVVTTTNIYYISDVFAASPTITNQFTFSSSSFYRNMDADYIFDVGQYLVCASHHQIGTTAIHVVISTDGGSTWSSETQVGTSSSLVGIPGLHVSTSYQGAAYVFATESIGVQRFYYITNYNSIAASDDIADSFSRGTGLHFHFGDSQDRYGWHGMWPDTNSSNRLYRTDFDTNTMQEVSPINANGDVSGPLRTAEGKFVISSAANNRNKLMVTTYGSTQYSTFFTSNCRATNPVWQDVTGGNAFYTRCQLNANGNSGYLWGNTGKIGYWNGSSVSSKDVSSTSKVVGLAVKA